MKKYVAQTKAWTDDGAYLPEASRQTLSVLEAERKPVDTGLLNENGDKLFRVEEMEPIGFVRLRDGA